MEEKIQIKHLSNEEVMCLIQFSLLCIHLKGRKKTMSMCEQKLQVFSVSWQKLL